MKALKAACIYTIVFVFTVSACVVIYFIGSIFSNHFRARTWVETPALVRDSDLHTARTAGVGSLSRPTFHSKVAASYSYVFNGREYMGTRVDFSIGSDNFSDSRRRAQLERLRSGSVTVFVNPDKPGESVFDRSLPGGETAFFLFFLLFPCGLGTSCIFGLLFRGLSMAGATWTDRFLLPALGVFHGVPAFYPVLFAPVALGVVPWIVLVLFLALFLLSIWTIFRRILDPSLGVPAKPARGRKKGVVLDLGRS